MFSHHIYLTDTREITGEKQFEELLLLVPPQRQEKVRGFRRENDRKLSLCAGLLLQYGMKQAGLPENAEIVLGEQGKPFFRSYPEVQFNLSHAGHTAVCVFSDRPVGVDYEIITCFDDKMAAYVFLPDEIERIKQQAGGNSCDALYTRLWTVKESILKYLGVGLTYGPKRVHIGAGEELLGIRGFSSVPKLHLTVFETEEGILSVCSELSPFPANPCPVQCEVLLSARKR